MYIYITNLVQMKNIYAHWFTDHFTSPEMSVRVDFDGLPLEIDTHRHFRTSKMIS